MLFMISGVEYDILTGSYETGAELAEFVRMAGIDGAVHEEEWGNAPYTFKAMTAGRNGPNDAYPGSEALDDTGGFYEVDDEGMVTLTDKAKSCIKELK